MLNAFLSEIGELFANVQGRNEEGAIPRALNHYKGAESLRGARRRMTAEGVEMSRQCHKYFLQ